MERHGYIQLMQYGEMKTTHYRDKDGTDDETTKNIHIYLHQKMVQKCLETDTRDETMTLIRSQLHLGSGRRKQTGN